MNLRIFCCLLGFFLLVTNYSLADVAVVTNVPEYFVSPNETFTVQVHLDFDDATTAFDPHPNGVFSAGVSVEFPSNMAAVSGVGSVTPVPELNFFGFNSPALKQVVAGCGPC